MARPRVVVLTTAVDYSAGVDVPAAPHDLTGVEVRCVVSDRASASAALDAALRGADLLVQIDLREGEREEFLDHLRRVAEVVEPTPGTRPGPDHFRLLAELRRGATLDEAARTLAVSRRTAARRLSDLRAHFGVRTVAELLLIVDD